MTGLKDASINIQEYLILDYLKKIDIKFSTHLCLTKSFPSIYRIDSQVFVSLQDPI